jgi:Uma2 family endonuclease
MARQGAIKRGGNQTMPSTFRTDDGQTVADLIERLGSISPRRIRLNPSPGKATEQDLIRANDHSGRLFELVEGTLVEKAPGHSESGVTLDLAYFLKAYLRQSPLGYLTGPDGATRLIPGLVRVPDIAYFAWTQLPKRERMTEPVAGIPPSLAVEVFSPSNTRKEMKRKLREYFLAGTKLVWYVDPKARTIQVFSSPESSVTLTESDTLAGADILPGLKVPIADIFAEIPKPATKAKNPRRRRL